MNIVSKLGAMRRTMMTILMFIQRFRVERLLDCEHSLQKLSLTFWIAAVLDINSVVEKKLDSFLFSLLKLLLTLI